nr:hypothetical protein [Tanacetum cinerariifolium]
MISIHSRTRQLSWIVCGEATKQKIIQHERKKITLAVPGSLQQLAKPLQIEGPPPDQWHHHLLSSQTWVELLLPVVRDAKDHLRKISNVTNAAWANSRNVGWRAIVDGLSDVVVTNTGTIRQFAMKVNIICGSHSTCVSLLPVMSDTKGHYCKIGQANGCTTTGINVMKKKYKMLSNFNYQNLDGVSPFPSI